MRIRSIFFYLVFWWGMSCFIIPYNQSVTTDFRNQNVFLVCASIFFPHWSVFISSHASWFLQLIFHGFQYLNKGEVSDPSANGISAISTLPLLAAVAVAGCCCVPCSVALLMWGFPCSEQAVPWLRCLRHRFLHCLSKIAAVPELSKQLILLEWHWLYWRHVQTKIYARRVGTRLFTYSVSADFLFSVPFVAMCTQGVLTQAPVSCCLHALNLGCFQISLSCFLKKPVLKIPLVPLLHCSLTTLWSWSTAAHRLLHRGTFIYFKIFIKGAGFMWQIASFRKFRF